MILSNLTVMQESVFLFLFRLRKNYYYPYSIYNNIPYDLFCQKITGILSLIYREENIEFDVFRFITLLLEMAGY